MKYIAQYILIVIFTGVICSCGKNYLDLKPEKSQRIPVTIADFQALTDYSELVMNYSALELGVIGSDEYTISDLRYETFPVQNTNGMIGYQKNAYSWQQYIYTGGETSDWQSGYNRILRTNVALAGLSKINPSDQQRADWNNAQGCALFHRGFNFYNLAQLYCEAYDTSTADTDLGLPLRVNADVTEKVIRSSLQNTFDLILADLEEAKSLLPEQSETCFRPGKAAVYALLSRVYLQMGDYGQAGKNAEACLSISNRLMDFNGMNLDLRYPFPVNGIANPEILFMSQMSNIYITSQSSTSFNAAQSLLDSYTGNDLRKKAYWFANTDGRILFKGSYIGNVLFFAGLATDEVYLSSAECNARLGRLDRALNDLNKLAENRYDKNSFVRFTANSKEELLKLIFSERKKELVLRGTRWEDLKRLNKETAFATTLVREISGKRYELKPNGDRYQWPLPIEAVALGGYEQNPR